MSLDTEVELTVVTLGDSVLDRGHDNAFGLDPGQLLTRNADRLFQEFHGRDLASRQPVRLDHRAIDGATVDDLPDQAVGLATDEAAFALLSIGGNDLMAGLLADPGPGIEVFASRLERFLEMLTIRPLYVATVYDPTVGDDRVPFLGLDPAISRANHRRVNAVLAAAGERFGAVVDLHAHFLTGDPSWLTQTIETSLRGTSEIRRAFLDRLVA